jgi:hypothetical protein
MLVNNGQFQNGMAPSPQFKNKGQLPFITMDNLKSLCETYNVQLNLIIKPDQIKIKAIKLDRTTGLQSKSQSATINDNEIAATFTIDNINRLIRNVLTDVF